MPINSSKNQIQQILGLKTDIDSNNSKTGFYGVEFDSRNIRGGEMFIALPGQNIHGNVFAKKAIENGAALALVEEGNFIDKILEEHLIVKDSLEAFTTISTWWRQEVGLPVAAITGSVGKTTVK